MKRLTQKLRNWLIAMGFLVTPDRRMFRIKVNYTYNEMVGSIWVVADSYSMAIEQAEKKLREKYYVREFQDLEYRFNGRVAEVRIISRLRWL